MSDSLQIFLDRKERLRGEGKVELPLNIDTNRYLVWKISLKDVIIVSPMLVLSLITIFILYKTGNLNQVTLILSLTPTIILGVFRTITHAQRKNLKFLDYGVIWKIQFKFRSKQFYYTKGAINMANNPYDTRTRLGIKTVFASCYETTDDRFVKVLEVSNINLSLKNKSETESIFNSYRNFINEVLITDRIQISQIAQPVNLTRHLMYIDEVTKEEVIKNSAKRELIKSYKKYIDKTQKSRDMVQRKKYIIFDQKIGSDREKALQEIERKATLFKQNIENMVLSDEKLRVKELNNDELIRLLYTCLDYDNSLALGDRIIHRANNRASISLGEKSAREIIDQLSKQLEERIS